MSLPTGTASVSLAWRTRGYNDALQKRPKKTDVPDEHRAVYLSGYRRGTESLERIAEGDVA